MDGGHMTHVNEFLNRPVSAFRRSPGRTAGVVVAIAAVLVSSVGAIPARADASPCGPTVNAIVCENNQPGNPPSDWDISGAGDSTIQGYATDISVNVGQPIDFKIKTDASTYTIDIYRLGWYGGNGARFVQSVSLKTPLPVQDACITSPSTGLADCGNWKVSATWNVPAPATSHSSCATTPAPRICSSKPRTPPGTRTTCTAGRTPTPAAPGRTGAGHTSSATTGRSALAATTAAATSSSATSTR